MHTPRSNTPSPPRGYGLSRLVGVLTDIHGDLQALDAALPRLREMGCDPILCAGDLIDMEPLGEECVQRLKSEKNLICILGNHERWALESRRRTKDVRRFFEPCNLSDHFGGGAELSRDSLAWLATLPAHWEGEMEGVRLAMWHARPGSDMEGIDEGDHRAEAAAAPAGAGPCPDLDCRPQPRGVRAGGGRPAGKNSEPRLLLLEKLRLQA